MSTLLRLEYTCGPGEIDRARTLNLRKQLGGGSKWRTNVRQFAMLVAMLLGAWFRFREIPPGLRALMLAAIVGGGCLFVLWKRRFREAALPPTQLEISESDVTIIAADSRVSLPWSSFSDCLESPDLFVLLDRPKQTLIIVPKRAFPSESWQAWFREQATHAPSHATQAWSAPPVPAFSTNEGHITLTVRLRFWDYLASTMTSWRTLGMCLCLGGLLLGISLSLALNPAPDAITLPAKAIALLVFPSFFVCATTIVMILLMTSWRLSAKEVGSQEITLSEQSVTFSGADGSGILPWTSFKRYKETPWSFILWRGSHWMMLPKRAFASSDELSRCRELLDQHLKQSRWFIG